MTEEQSTSPMPGPAGAPTRSARHPERVGPYHVLKVLGEGGMGVVYEAEQTNPVHRRVAVKLLRAGFESTEIVARFEAERQALAVMTHESIATVFDAGTTDAGRPYFVMELVRGVPITDYCDTNKLSTRDRVALFIPVCRAIQHAHQKGVIHRDLKPSNILVAEADGRPVPKVIDFGIAKATGQRLTEHTLVTQFGQAVGTPAYMSPEQAEMSGLDVDTRTDVYSLGVVLYELLVGRLPIDPQEVGLPGFMAKLAMRETDPPTPSARLATLAREREVLARLRHTDPEGLRKQLRGDLDWITMRAMEKDRGRRYETANGLASDLARFLADQPVEARPPSTAYRLRKFVRRNKVGVAAIAAVGLALVAGAAAATVGLVRATRAEARARAEAATAQQVSDFLVGLFKVSSPDEARGNVITAREILDSGAARVERDLARQPVVQARLMNTIGDVYRELGLYQQARPLLERALATRERVAPSDSIGIAGSLLSIGRLHQWKGQYDEAEKEFRRAMGLAQRADSTHPVLRRTFTSLADLLRDRGRYAEADSMSHRALALIEHLAGPDDPSVADELTGLAIAQAEQGRPVQAESLFRRVLGIRERTVGELHSLTGRAVGNLASALFEQGKLAQAESLYHRGLAIDTQLYGADHAQIALDLYNIANVEGATSRPEQAIARYRRAIELWERTLGPEHPYVAAGLTSLSNALGSQGRHRETLPLLQRALAIRQKTLDPEHPFLATTYNELGVAARRAGRYEEAERYLDRALALRQKILEPNSYYIAVTIGALADLERARGRQVAAESLYRRAIAQWEASGRDAQGSISMVSEGYVQLLRQQGRTAEAAAVEAKSR
jgi:non-specific serine/threonine protein kinase/serine/threonine-protein kinase